VRNPDQHTDEHPDQHPDGNPDGNGDGDGNTDRNMYTERNAWNTVRPDGQCSDDCDKLAELRGIVRHVRRLYGG
jgi:hypothetical protein